MTTTSPLPRTRSEIADEIGKCAASRSYFVNRYVQIFDAQAQGWIPFTLWREQEQMLRAFDRHQLIIALKARQLGITWLCLGGDILWSMLFRPKAVALIFSKRDDEATYLLNEERLKGMYQRLPEWMQARSVTTDSAHQFGLSNGSIAYAFPTTGGDGYTATNVLVDEADLVPNFSSMMRSVKPTIDAGGKMIMISRVDKEKPESGFKNIYRGARDGANAWHPIFLPWHVRPERTRAWHEQQKQDALTNTGSLDDVYEQYPETDEQALMTRSSDKRIPGEWLLHAYAELPPLSDKVLQIAKAPAVPGLQVFKLPKPERRYVMGADTAEGNPTSDDSALDVLDAETGEQMAVLVGKFEPESFAMYIDQTGVFFNAAPVLVERNNHGHAVLLALKHTGRTRRLKGADGKDGWQTNAQSKALMYSNAVTAYRDSEGVLHDRFTYRQLASIVGSTLSAPEGQKDDRAMADVLARQAQIQAVRRDVQPAIW